MDSDPLTLWSDTEPDGLGPPSVHDHRTTGLQDQTTLSEHSSAQDHTELDNISPSLIVSSLSDVHANYLLDDLHTDYVLSDCADRGAGTLALDYVPPVLPQHSHGPYPCSFTAEACPLNPFSDDPVFGDDQQLMTPETAVTLRASSRVQKPVVTASPDTPTRPVCRRPLRHVVKPVPVSSAVATVYRDPPPYPGLTRQERTDESQFYTNLLPRAQRLGLSERSLPRLKVVRRIQSPAMARHHADGPYPTVSSPSVVAPRRQLQHPSASRLPAAGQPAESLHTKPSLSYVNLITLSLLNSETGSLRCNEIYDFLMRVFPYFREVSSKTWKNDTRHALSSNQSSSNFCKAPESKDPSGAANRGALWMAKPEKVAFLHEHLSKTYYKMADNIKESMENPELYDELLRGLPLYGHGDSGFSPCDQSPTIGSTTDSPDEA